MKFCKFINYVGWASGIFGGLLMLCGTIGYLTGTGFLSVRNFYNYFFIAIDFLLLGIFILLGTRCFGCHCKDEKEEKAK